MIEKWPDAPLLIQALRYWEEKRRGRDMPDRGDIDPMELGRALLPNLLLVDVLDGGHYRFRLVGTEIVRRLGFDPTGRLVNEVLSGAYGEHVLAFNRLILETRAPAVSESLHRWDDGGHAITRRLGLPLSHGAGVAAMILVAQVFERLQGDPPPPKLRGVGREEIERLVRRSAA